MNPGKFDKRITIERQRDFVDEHKITKNRWEPIKTCWACANKLWGKEYWNAKEYNQENCITFIIRYSSIADVSEKDRIIWGSKVFNIIDVDDVEFKHEYIKIKALEDTR